MSTIAMRIEMQCYLLRWSPCGRRVRGERRVRLSSHAVEAAASMRDSACVESETTGGALLVTYDASWLKMAGQ